MNTNPPATGAEEGAVSAPLEKLPKLNLPPKPVLATAQSTSAPLPPPPPPAGAAPVVKETSVPPAMPSPPPSKAQLKKPESPAPPTANKKHATLSISLAIVIFLVALLGLIIQLFAFLYLF